MISDQAHLVSEIKTASTRASGPEQSGLLDERGMHVNRMFIMALLWVYFIATQHTYTAPGLVLTILVGFSIYTCIAAAWIAYWPEPPAARRVFCIIADMGTLSTTLYFGGDPLSILYPIYLWVILGTGFRFSVRYLAAATCSALVGFGLVVIFSPAWNTTPFLAFGLWIGLLLIPVYSARLISRLHEAKRIAEEAGKAHTMFAASVSHELRTPLNAIVAIADLLPQREIDRETRSMVTSIKSAAGSLLCQIENVLDFTQIGRGESNRENVPINLIGLMQDVQSSFRVAASEKDLEIGFSLFDIGAGHVIGDRTKIQKILLNLVGNAVKFTATGYVHVSASAKPGNGDGHIMLELAVADSGPGIAPDELKLIFEPFRRSEGLSARKVAGNGLGLALVASLTEQLGGTVGVSSAVGEGSRFSISLPVATAPVEAMNKDLLHINVVLVHGEGKSPDPALRQVAGQTFALDVDDLERIGEVLDSRRHNVILVDGRELVDRISLERLRQRLQNNHYDVSFIAVSDQLCAELRHLPQALSWLACLERKELTNELHACLQLADRAVSQASEDVDKLGLWVERPLRILVAEDNALNQNVVRAMLTRLGHVSQIVPDGAAAIDAVLESNFDLVLMDVNMPVMDGIEATKSIRAFSGQTGRRLIYGLTADASTTNINECLDAGMDGCLTKPLRAHQLNKLCRDIFKAQQVADLAAEGTLPGQVSGRAEMSDVNGALSDSLPSDAMFTAPKPAAARHQGLLPRSPAPTSGATPQPAGQNVLGDAPTFTSPAPDPAGGSLQELPAAPDGRRQARATHPVNPGAKNVDNVDDISVDFDVLDEVIATAGVEALPSFLELLSSLLEEQTTVITNAIDQGDDGAIAAALHKLRGGAATVGAREISRAIRRSEHALRTGNNGPAENFAIDNERLYERFAAAVDRRYLATDGQRVLDRLTPPAPETATVITQG